MDVERLLRNTQPQSRLRLLSSATQMGTPPPLQPSALATSPTFTFTVHPEAITRVTLQWNWDGSAFAASAYPPSEYHNQIPIASLALQYPSPNREQDGGASPRKYTTNAVRVLESLLVAARSAHTVSAQDLNALHSRILDLANTALKPEGGKLPAEQRVLYVLEQLQALAKNLIDGQDLETSGTQRPTTSQGSSATSALLGSVNTRPYPSFISQASLLNLISEKAEEVLRHPTIFITPAILKSYVDLQTLLHQPSSLPDIFDLYARKPIPSLSPTGNMTYGIPSPSKINSAIPTPTANLALQSAIAAHNLSLCLDIITTTFSAPAYRRALIVRRAALPFAGLAVLPLAAYTASQAFATQFQTSMSPSYATGIAFAGIMAYTIHVSTIGYVAITTSNDQMDRVTWAQGVPLWERWVREEERAAVDALAGKWGFGVRNRRGEEEGEEWEVLREFVGLRGMELDRAELMEGME
ncbi:hypothetical protein LTR91_025604 [Friedmanniomyces endolithicus]|uniref:Uncharacterized protein n=1 Tax=Friedmanniomyces endolithicus TaxID=329885 RepID=A0AAN6GZW7_9PEZI|nr:hypothetical protein LTR57_022903 [Friedmanniomyces endolithicus]KAK0950525.1 hypothetical protein LTR91_025604 [Friedmanniomyces endolithicus]KAK0956767.1 hypothetical protein LTS01_022691 [Friedmanniomyces endolithicus]KAK1036376.1 hypothetical protein LTS16_013805 [Friedmanniomyces endolithicus]